MNLRDIVNGINVVCSNYPTIQEFGEGDIYNYLNTGEHKYPCVFLTISNIGIGEGDTNVVYGNLFYVDRLLNDYSNRLNIQSVGMSSLNVIFDKIEENLTCTITKNTYQPFTEQFADLTAGVYCDFEFEFVSPVECGEYDEITLTVTENGLYSAIGYNKILVNVAGGVIDGKKIVSYVSEESTEDLSNNIISIVRDSNDTIKKIYIIGQLIWSSDQNKGDTTK